MEQWKSEMLSAIFRNDGQLVDLEKGLGIKYENVPKKLYKYYSFNEYSKKNLLDSTVWLSFPEKFNDPYDCALTYSVMDLFKHDFPSELQDIFSNEWHGEEKLTNSEKKQILGSENSLSTFMDTIINKNVEINSVHREGIKNGIYNYIHSSIYEMFKPLSDINKKSMVISCFSELNDSMLMWSHYASYHKGFCLEYDFSLLPPTDIFTQLLYPVIYQNELLNITEYLQTDDPKNIFSVRAAITKSKVWEYEKEWRIIAPFGLDVKELAWRVPLPKSIYAGSKMENDNYVFLKEYAEKNNIELYLAKMNKNNFKIDFIKANGI
jgi:hypothetical protein